MEFWAASESDLASYPAVEKVRRAFEPVFRELLSDSGLTATKLLLRYVPIVMPPDLVDNYPCHTKARPAQRILDCAPQLDYEIFVRGSFADQVQAYAHGIRAASPLLPKFGFSPANVSDFEMLLSRAAANCAS